MDSIDITEYIENNLEDEDFSYNLSMVLDQLPVSRESVENVLSAILSFDVLNLYLYLLEDDKKELLSGEEYSSLCNRFFEIFDADLFPD